MEKVYDFGLQLERGKYFEKLVDHYLIDKMNMNVEEVPMEFERVGIDRIATSQATRTSMTIEIKADEQGFKTGNAFIETISVEQDGEVKKWGWVCTSQAQVLIYYLPQVGEMIFVDMPRLKRYFFSKNFRTVEILNKTYLGRGGLMPLEELRALAFHIGLIEPASLP